MSVQVAGDLTEGNISMKYRANLKSILIHVKNLYFSLKITEMHFKYLLNEFAYLYMYSNTNLKISFTKLLVDLQNFHSNNNHNNNLHISPKNNILLISYINY